MVFTCVLELGGLYRRQTAVTALQSLLPLRFLLFCLLCLDSAARENDSVNLGHDRIFVPTNAASGNRFALFDPWPGLFTSCPRTCDALLVVCAEWPICLVPSSARTNQVKFGPYSTL